MTRTASFRTATFPSSRALSARGWGSADTGQHRGDVLQRTRQKARLTLETPIEEFSEQALDELLYGTGDEPLELSVSRISGGVMRQPFEGIIPNLERRYRETNSEWSRGEIEEVMSEVRVRRATAAVCARRCWRSRSAD